MPSFTEFPAGEDKFTMTRTAPLGFSLAIRPENFAPLGTMEWSTGPYAKPLLVHSAMLSATLAPLVKALGAFDADVGSQ